MKSPEKPSQIIKFYLHVLHGFKKKCNDELQVKKKKKDSFAFKRNIQKKIQDPLDKLINSLDFFKS